jgi:hypothetical protein
MANGFLEAEHRRVTSPDIDKDELETLPWFYWGFQAFSAARRKKVLTPHPHGVNSVVEGFVEGFSMLAADFCLVRELGEDVFGNHELQGASRSGHANVRSSTSCREEICKRLELILLHFYCTAHKTLENQWWRARESNWKTLQSFTCTMLCCDYYSNSYGKQRPILDCSSHPGRAGLRV